MMDYEKKLTQLFEQLLVRKSYFKKVLDKKGIEAADKELERIGKMILLLEALKKRKP